MPKPNLIDCVGQTWIHVNGENYARKENSHFGALSRSLLEFYYGPIREEESRKEEKVMKADTVETHVLCPECGEEYDVSVTLSRIEDHVWEPRLVRHSGDKGQRAHRCVVPPMGEPRVGAIVTVNNRHFVHVIREGANSSYDWVELGRGSHTTWAEILLLGNPSLGYYDNTLEY